MTEHAPHEHVWYPVMSRPWCVKPDEEFLITREPVRTTVVCECGAVDER